MKKASTLTGENALSSPARGTAVTNSSSATRLGGAIQTRRYIQARAARLASILEDYAELIADLFRENGEARIADIARALGVTGRHGGQGDRPPQTRGTCGITPLSRHFPHRSGLNSGQTGARSAPLGRRCTHCDRGTEGGRGGRCGRHRTLCVRRNYHRLRTLSAAQFITRRGVIEGERRIFPAC